MEHKLLSVYANTINRDDVKTNIFVPPNEGLNPSLQGIMAFHKDKWPKNLEQNEDKIFEFKSPKVPVDDSRFKFHITQLTVDDLLQLDMRRDIYHSGKRSAGAG